MAKYKILREYSWMTSEIIEADSQDEAEELEDPASAGKIENSDNSYIYDIQMLDDPREA